MLFNDNQYYAMLLNDIQCYSITTIILVLKFMKKLYYD